MMSDQPDGRLRRAERALTAAAVVLLGWWLAATLDAHVYQMRASRALDDMRRADAKQVAAFRERSRIAGAIVGRIEIPRLRVSAMVRHGVDDTTLRRAVGRIPSTSTTLQSGNMALAAHRDTFFRRLGEVERGDEVRFTSPEGRFRYVVRGTRVVEPDDLWVLGPTRHPMLTLITCYPFEYLGDAPQRFVVRAELLESLGQAAP